MVKLSTYGNIKDGKLTLSNRKRFNQDLLGFKDCQVELTIKKKGRRSSQQNRYLWGVVYKEIEVRLRELGNDIDSEFVHYFCKGKFNPVYLVGEGGEMLGTNGGSTTEMNKEEFSIYVDKIIEWAASFLSISIPEANSDLQLQF